MKVEENIKMILKDIEKGILLIFDLVVFTDLVVDQIGNYSNLCD